MTSQSKESESLDKVNFLRLQVEKLFLYRFLDGLFQWSICGFAIYLVSLLLITALYTLNPEASFVAYAIFVGKTFYFFLGYVSLFVFFKLGDYILNKKIYNKEKTLSNKIKYELKKVLLNCSTEDTVLILNRFNKDDFIYFNNFYLSKIINEINQEKILNSNLNNLLSKKELLFMIDKQSKELQEDEIKEKNTEIINE